MQVGACWGMGREKANQFQGDYQWEKELSNINMGQLPLEGKREAQREPEGEKDPSLTTTRIIIKREGGVLRGSLGVNEKSISNAARVGM